MDDAIPNHISQPTSGPAVHPSSPSCSDQETSAYPVQYDSHGFPQTLLDWRREPHKTNWTARHLWVPLEEIFESKGYRLFISRPDYEGCHTPKIDGEERAPDRYHHVVEADGRGHRCQSFHASNKMVPATCIANGKHVMIHLVCKGGFGQSELDILRYFSQPSLRSLPENHVIPLLDVVEHLDMIFAVTPLFSTGYATPWFHTYDEVLEAMEQSIEGMAFIHSHLVAHRDFSTGELLLNFGGSLAGPLARKARNEQAPFRSYFPVRYYIIDFEMSVKFDHDSTPAERMVKGLPQLLLYTHGTEDPAKYGKPMPPEWVSGEFYCPFKSDVYQLAKVWQETLVIKGARMHELKLLLDTMSKEDPRQRPTAAEALLRLRAYRQSLSKETLEKWVYPYEEEFPFQGEDGLLEPGTGPG